MVKYSLLVHWGHPVANSPNMASPIISESTRGERLELKTQLDMDKYSFRI